MSKTKYLCKKKFDRLVVFCFDEVPIYNPLLDYWDDKGKRILDFDQARPYIYEVWFENSPFKVE